VPDEIDLIGLREAAPRFIVAALPEAERSKADELNLVIWELGANVAHFRHAVELLRFCSEEIATLPANEDKRERMRNFLAWRLVAARDGAMTLFHFSKLLSRILPLARACPTIWPHVEIDTVRSARRQFRKQFAKAEDHRHVIGHAGEQSLPDFAYARSGRAHLRAAMVGDVLISTWKDGEVMRCEITRSAAERLDAIKSRAISGLRNAMDQSNARASP
jgi:hypothetical protein